MANPGMFDLNAAIARWREDIAQFPSFRAENGEELEAHLRDSITKLREAGLSDEEAFLIARSRLGKMESLGTEFAKVTSNTPNRIAHALVFLFFATGCFFVWGMLMLPRMMGQAMGRSLPGFTTLCMQLKWVLYLLPVAAAVYVTFVCLRRSGSRNSWVAFLATSVAVLVLLGFPVMVAVILPIIDLLHVALS